MFIIRSGCDDGCDDWKNTGFVHVIAIVILNYIKLSSLILYHYDREMLMINNEKILLSYSENWFQADKYTDVYALVLPPAGDSPVCP